MMGLRPIKMPSAKERVAAELRKAILSRQMKEVEVLSLESVASQLNVSAMPVREAFQILARDGLIQLRKNKAAVVLGVTETYIKEHYQQQHLYKDCLHYQNCMYFEIARRMNQILGLYVEQSINELEQACKDENLNFIDFTEIPILPCVEKALGITYADDAKQYRVRNFNGTISLMTRKEWIQAYADYTRSILQVKKFFNL